MAKKVYCVFDTETLGLNKKWIYDLGMVIVEKTGNPLFSQRWIIQEVMEIPNISQIAFYGAKMETFYKGMETVKFSQAQAEFNRILDEFAVTSICAYNMGFDMASVADTLKYVNGGKKFLQRKMEYFDIWNAACDSFFQQKQFTKIAKKEGWMSEKGNFRTTAEIAYRFVSKDYQFVESHTALEDASIEAIILQEIFRQKKKVEKNSITTHPWKKVQK